MSHITRHLRTAIRLSIEKQSRNDGGPFGAVVVKHDEVVGTGWNRVTVPDEPDPTAHAEIVAIREACRNLKTFSLQGCDLYASCEPCPMCLAAVCWAQIDRVYYAATRDDAANAGFADSALAAQLLVESRHPKLQLVPELREEALLAFRKWLRKEDRIEY